MIREYGMQPFRIVVIHGGPGAGGEMAPVARFLSHHFGVIEPIQTADSVSEQVKELADVLFEYNTTPLILIGYSWGAWLSLLVTAEFPKLVQQVILVGSGPFTEEYLPQMQEMRRNRLSRTERDEYDSICNKLHNTATPSDSLLARLGNLCEQSDNFDLCPSTYEKDDCLPVNEHIYQRVWHEAAMLRKSGELLHRVAKVKCPVTAIHGAVDPHPAAGVQDVLSQVLSEFHFHLLPKCGHTPWQERHAAQEFYRILEQEIG